MNGNNMIKFIILVFEYGADLCRTFSEGLTMF